VSAILTITLLTIREAVRRRLVAAFAAITVALVGLSAWGFDRLGHNARMTSGEVGLAVPQAFILFMFMFSFVVALSASAIASSAVSYEIDSGVLQTIVARPVRRSDVLLGKWLGLTFLLGAYTAIVCGLEVAVVYWVSGYIAPDPALSAAYLFAEGGVLLTLVLLLSTRLSAIAAGVVGVALFGIAWLAGVVGAFGSTFNIGGMRTASHISQYLLPTDGLWHAAIYSLEPHSFVAAQLSQSSGSQGGEAFFAQAGPSGAYLAWAGIWFVLILLASLLSFERREL
jgi:ABC-type transport system involved in multi-copper enzyme maturation permease subunit